MYKQRSVHWTPPNCALRTNHSQGTNPGLIVVEAAANRTRCANALHGAAQDVN